jgi:hypothetical protein
MYDYLRCRPVAVMLYVKKQIDNRFIVYSLQKPKPSFIEFQTLLHQNIINGSLKPLSSDCISSLKNQV